jgi:hypothetical protein
VIEQGTQDHVHLVKLELYFHNLRDEGRRGAGLVLPVGGEDASALVVAAKAVHTGLDQNQAELGVGVLQMLRN